MTKFTIQDFEKFGFQHVEETENIDLHFQDYLVDRYLELVITDEITLIVNTFDSKSPLVIEKLDKITNKKTVITDDEFLEYHKEFREIHRLKRQYANLSKINLELSIDDLINYLLDNGFKGVINDLSCHDIEYDIVDLITVINHETIWSRLSNELKRNLPGPIYPI